MDRSGESWESGRVAAMRADTPPPVKASFGIILCRQNLRTRRVEVLLIQKRYTYEFAEFVHGRYARSQPTRRPRVLDTAVALAERKPRPALFRPWTDLLAAMTREELLDVYSLNFSQMWYRIWLLREEREFFNRKLAKFQAIFLREDGGTLLRQLVLQTRPRGAVIWEPPKGHRSYQREPAIVCGIRELNEETNRLKSEYSLLPGVCRRVSYVHSGTRYTCTHFVAVAGARLAQADLTRPLVNGMAEIRNIGWFDIEQVRLLDHTTGSRLEALVAPVFRHVKRHLKGRTNFRGPLRIPLPKTARPPARAKKGAIVDGA